MLRVPSRIVRMRGVADCASAAWMMVNVRQVDVAKALHDSLAIHFTDLVDERKQNTREDVKGGECHNSRTDPFTTDPFTFTQPQF